MLLTILAYAMIIVFMYVVMKKKMSPFTALIIVPLVAVISNRNYASICYLIFLINAGCRAVRSDY